MRDPAFWWRRAGLAANLLAPAAAAYGAIAARSFKQRGLQARVPVVCVGNLTVGGGGKTPTALAIAKIYREAGHRPVFLTRGYGGRLAGPVRVDIAAHRAVDVGDEPLLLARVAPTVVSGDRVAGAGLAAAIGADVIVMDDGFQNPSLAKDFALLVVDGRRGIGNGRLLPAGPLRAPLALQLDHADALLVIGDATEARGLITQAADRALAIFYGHFEPDQALIAALKTEPVLAYAGIADPGKFFATLAAAGISASATVAFPDHHRYAPADASRLLAHADRDGLRLLTTEKDLARMRGEPQLAALVERSSALPITLALQEPDAVRRLVLEVTRTKRSPS
jgi:tetraacyldisaccharide 4'-kinase